MSILDKKPSEIDPELEKMKEELKNKRTESLTLEVNIKKIEMKKFYDEWKDKVGTVFALPCEDRNSFHHGIEEGRTYHLRKLTKVVMECEQSVRFIFLDIVKKWEFETNDIHGESGSYCSELKINTYSLLRYKPYFPFKTTSVVSTERFEEIIKDFLMKSGMLSSDIFTQSNEIVKED